MGASAVPAATARPRGDGGGVNSKCNALTVESGSTRDAGDVPVGRVEPGSIRDAGGVPVGGSGGVVPGAGLAEDKRAATLETWDGVCHFSHAASWAALRDWRVATSSSRGTLIVGFLIFQSLLASSRPLLVTSITYHLSLSSLIFSGESASSGMMLSRWAANSPSVGTGAGGWFNRLRFSAQ